MKGKQKAVRKLVNIILRIGPCYHPDTLMCDYVFPGTGKPSFTGHELAKLTADHYMVLTTLDSEDVYAIALPIITMLNGK